MAAPMKQESPGFSRGECQVPGAASDTARAVAGNVEAMESALVFADASLPIDVDAINAIHRRLLAGTRDARNIGRRKRYKGKMRRGFPRSATFLTATSEPHGLPGLPAPLLRVS